VQGFTPNLVSITHDQLASLVGPTLDALNATAADLQGPTAP